MESYNKQQRGGAAEGMEMVYDEPPSLDDIAMIDDDEALARALQEEFNAADARRNAGVAEFAAAPSGGVVVRGMPVAPSAPMENELTSSRRSFGESARNRPPASRSNQAPRRPVRSSSSRSMSNSSHSSHGQRRPPQRVASSDALRRPPSRSSSRDMDAEMKRYASSRSMNSSRHAPARTTSSGSAARMPPSRSSSADTLETIRAAQEWRDEQYARRLQKELSKAQEQSRLKAPPAAAAAAAAGTTTAAVAQSKKSGTETPKTSRSMSLSSDLALQASVWDDEEVARRFQQEQEDERLARNITKLQASQSRRALQQQASQRRRRPSCITTCCRYLFPLAVIGVMAVIIYFVIYNPESLPDWMPDPEDFVNEDPFNQQTPGETSRWRNRGKGLELVVVNALDDEWYPYFYTAVNQWDGGRPDALTLRTEVQEPDKACSSIPGKLKVCNGNYGETFWRGINKLLLEGDSIYASAARMNEYYFRRDDDDQRQYTMCHEMGHGFGLPHSDESFVNKDLGNCMDYTNRPANNRQPDTSNFLFLEELYGVVPGSEPSSSAGGTVEQQQSVFQGNDNGNRLLEASSSAAEHHENNNNNKSHLRVAARSSIPDRVLRAHQELDHEIEQGHTAMTSENGWNLLHRSPHGEAHEKHLGDGFKVQVHFLLAR